MMQLNNLAPIAENSISLASLTQPRMAPPKVGQRNEVANFNCSIEKIAVVQLLELPPGHNRFPGRISIAPTPTISVEVIPELRCLLTNATAVSRDVIGCKAARYAFAASTLTIIYRHIRPNHAHPPVTDAGEARLRPVRASGRGRYGREVSIAREVAARPRVSLPWIGPRGLGAAWCHVRDPLRFWSQQSSQNGSKTRSRRACGSSRRK
jgi:hypothetical protein